MDLCIIRVRRSHGSSEIFFQVEELSREVETQKLVDISAAIFSLPLRNGYVVYSSLLLEAYRGAPASITYLVLPMA